MWTHAIFQMTYSILRVVTVKDEKNVKWEECEEEDKKDEEEKKEM
jgi:hypothetical protein